MLSPSLLVPIIESALLGPSPPTPRQRVEFMHAIRSAIPSLRSLLSPPPPKASDRAQVQSKEVRLPDSGLTTLDDVDVWIALKLSDDLNLNEIDCVGLLVSANQEWGLAGREPLEILRLAAGLWYTNRRNLITALYLLLRAVVLDQGGHDAGLLADIQKHMEDLFISGLREQLVALIKELNREGPAGFGGPQAERYVLDSRGALVERCNVIWRERLSIGHCLVLSVLITRMGPKDVKYIFLALKDFAAELNGTVVNLKLQIVFSLLFSLVITFMSDALSAVSEKTSILSRDATFRCEFHELVMSTANDLNVEGFVDCVRFAWTVHLMITQDEVTTMDSITGASSSALTHIYSGLELIYRNNVFQFMLDKILRTAPFQNDDEDIIYMYVAYLHKLMMCFLSHPLTRDKVKEMKEKAMSALSPYGSGLLERQENVVDSRQIAQVKALPFVSLLDLLSEFYQKEPELVLGNEVLWTFVNFAGEDHSNFQTLVSFLRLLSTMASSEEGASKVFDLLEGDVFHSVKWKTLFDCLSIYEQKFKQALQSTGSLLPEFQEGDAKALVAYLNVLQKVVDNGNPVERKKWFPDIEPLFKLLSYENVPPYLKGALRNAITTFVRVSPVLRDTIWSYLERYDLPLVVGPLGSTPQQIPSQVYDMRYELNEVESRLEKYPSTVSFIDLLNALIAGERDVSDRGHRFLGIYRFVSDHVFVPFPQRTYVEPAEKWRLVVSCLEHFRIILSVYDVKDEDIDCISDHSELSVAVRARSNLALPILELMKDFMSCKSVFRNIMSILSPGVNSVIHERSNQIYGHLLEKAVHLSLEIIVLVLQKDLIVADFWRPLYQPLDVILLQDCSHIVALLEYVRYDFLPQIQQCSIKIMNILSGRIVGLVPMLLEANAANTLIEDYAACLELRAQHFQVIENIGDDCGILILQLLLDNISHPSPNITHLLLNFDLETSVESTVLQPKFKYSCLKIILDILEKLSRPDVNALLHEFSFRLVYELCVDPLTSGPTIDLLSSKRYNFFSVHLDTIGVAPLPKRSNNHTLRISSLHQRALLLKLLALELHSGDIASPMHRDACLSIVSQLYNEGTVEFPIDGDMTYAYRSNADHIGIKGLKSKALELLEVFQFKSPDISMEYPQFAATMKSQVEGVLANPATSEKGGVYYYSDRGDRLIDVASFRDKLWQLCGLMDQQLNSLNNEAEMSGFRGLINQLIRWCWKYNKNLEEQAAQLHMLAGWAQLVEVSTSKHMSCLENRSQILFQMLDSSLSSSASPDCSLKMAIILTQVALICLAKLRDERFMQPGGVNSDNVTCLDIIYVKQLPNGAFHSVLLKLMMAILRHETSEILRRRQYALLLSYFQYCQSVLDPDVPSSILQSLLIEEQDGDESLDLHKIDQEQAELSRANFLLLRKEVQSILDVVINDAVQGSEAGKTLSYFVLDAFISIDQERFFLGQLQSRGFLRLCFVNLSNFLSQDHCHTLESLQRVCTLEAELALLLRIAHNYGKLGAQVLFSMGALEHLSSCKMAGLRIQGSFRRTDVKADKDVSIEFNKQQVVNSAILRLVSCLTSLIHSDLLEVKDKIIRLIIDFVKAHASFFDQVLRESISEVNDSTLEQMFLVVSILSKVWPYEENDESSFVQGLFGMMHDLFSQETRGFNFTESLENHKKSELLFSRLLFSLCSYIHYLVTKKLLRLQVLDGSDEHISDGKSQPTLSLLVSFLGSVGKTLERVAEEKSLLLNKIQDINELSRLEVDKIITMCRRIESISSSDNIRKRRCIAMLQMCRVAGNRDQLITLLLQLAEQVLEILLIHLQERSYSMEDRSFMGGKLLPILERLELLGEDKMGRSLKVFLRLVSSLKELTIQKLLP